MSNADKVLFRTNLSADTIGKMRVIRKQVYTLATMIDDLGPSAELTLAFRKLQECLFYVNSHLCYVDDQAVKEPLVGD